MHGVKLEEARQSEHSQCFLRGDTNTQRSSRVKVQTKLVMLQGVSGHADKAWCRDNTALTRCYLNEMLKGNDQDAQSVKCLLCMHEDLCSIPRHVQRWQ